jgi:hypothetical protein
MMRVFREKFLQAWTACLLCMVQGDLTVLTLSHAFTASKTGLLTGIAYWVTTKFDGDEPPVWKAAWLTGVLTMASDIAIHPTHFGEQWVEAFCTGLGAAGICFIWEKVKK